MEQCSHRICVWGALFRVFQGLAVPIKWKEIDVPPHNVQIKSDVSLTGLWFILSVSNNLFSNLPTFLFTNFNGRRVVWLAAVTTGLQSWKKCVGTLLSQFCLVNFSSLLCHWRAKFECWYFILFCTWRSSLYGNYIPPLPYQTMLRGLACGLETWSRSTLYKGGGEGWYQIDDCKVSQHFFPNGLDN